MTLHDLENAISQLPPNDLAAFAHWFEGYFADAWDRKIEADIAAGRLDSAGKQADHDFESGRCHSPR